MIVLGFLLQKYSLESGKYDPIFYGMIMWTGEWWYIKMAILSRKLRNDNTEQRRCLEGLWEVVWEAASSSPSRPITATARTLFILRSLDSCQGTVAISNWWLCSAQFMEQHILSFFASIAESCVGCGSRWSIDKSSFSWPPPIPFFPCRVNRKKCIFMYE